MQPAQFALIASGVALAALGVLRLAGVTLRRMPAVVAAASVLTGMAVAASGVPLRRPPQSPSPPRAASSTQAPEAPGQGAITGSIRRPGGPGIAEAGVALHRFDGLEEVETRDATTGPDGAFVFGGLPIGPRIAYTVTTDYGGTTFRSGLQILDPHAPERDVELVVAETVADPAVLSVGVDSTVLVGEERGVEVVQILNVHNSSERAFVGQLRMPLLPRASGLDPRKGLDRTRLSLESGDLVSSAPILPGTTEVIYTYNVPMPPDGLTARRTFSYPTKRFALLVGDRLDVEAPALRGAGRVKLGERSYVSYRKSGLRSGSTIRATVRRTENSTARTAGVAAAALIALGAVAYPIVRRRRDS